MADLTRQGSVFLGTTHTNLTSSPAVKGWISSRDLILNSNQLSRTGLSRIKVTCIAQGAESGETRAKDSVQIKIFSELALFF